MCSLDDDSGSSNNDPAVPVPLPVTQATEPGPQHPIPVMTSTPNITCPIPSYTESSPINSTRDVKHVVGSIFPQVDISKVHHMICVRKRPTATYLILSLSMNGCPSKQKVMESQKTTTLLLMLTLVCGGLFTLTVWECSVFCA